MTTSPESDSSSNHPEHHHLLHRSPHDNRSLCDDRLHHQLHMLNLTVNYITPSTSPSLLITISRSQSRITSFTLSTWKNTYSNFNTVTIDFTNTTTIPNMDITHGTSPSITNNICPAMSSDHLQHDDQQLRHRHRYDLRYGHHSPCPPSNRSFYENDSFILDRNCETRTLKETLKKKIRAKFVYLTILKVIDKRFK